MPPLFSMAYLSSAVTPFSPAELDALLLDARAFNARRGVTGALLHHGGCFFQYLEGPREEVDCVYSRIKAAKSHHRLIELVAGPVARRHFEAWSMGFAEAPATDMQSLAQACWLQQLQQAGSADVQSDGLRLLLGYWRRARPFDSLAR